MSADPVAPQPEPSAGAHGRTWSPIHRDRQYLRLWAVGLLVSLARWVETLAFAVFAYAHTQSALWVASLMMLRMLPLGLFGVSLGALAVRVSRRKALLTGYTVMLAVNLGLLLLSLSGRIEVWHLVAVSALNGVLWAGDMPLRRGLIGDIAGPRRVAQAMSLDAAAASGCRLLGPVLGGWLMAHAGLPGVFLCSALLCLSIVLALVQLQEPVATAALAKRSVRAMLLEGFEAARESPQLLAALWLTMLFNLFAWPVLSMVPVIGQAHLGLDAQGVGLLVGLEGVGALLGALLLSLGAAQVRQAPVFLAAVLSFLVLQLLLAWSPHVLLAAVALLLLGMAQAGFGAMQSTLAYTAAPTHRRAQAMGLMTMCIGVSPLGFMWVGLLAEWLGTSAAIVVCSVCGGLGVALTWPICRACLRESPGPRSGGQ